MRIARDDSTEEPQPEDGVNGIYSSAASRRSRRRKQAAIGTVGLLSILGAGALAAYNLNDDRDAAPAARTAVADPGVPAADATPDDAAGTTGTPSKPSPASGSPESAGTVEQRVAAVKSTAAKAGPGVLRPLPPVSATGDVTVTRSVQNGGMLKVVSAREDLTGYQELGWVADPGKKVGNARCSDRIRLSVDAKAIEHPTLLLCWRTSAQKSVYTLAVKTGGRPSAKSSVASLDKQWSKLG